jgi:glutamate racemase
MKLIIIDSGLGGKDFITKYKNLYLQPNLKCEFVKPFENMINTYSINYIRENIINLLHTFNNKYVYSIIIACNSISSCIIDILFLNNFIINGINIYEPIIPICLYIQQKNIFKNILILSTPLTHKIRWHYRLLNANNRKIKYVLFPLLAKELEEGTSYSKSLDRLDQQKQFIQDCHCVVLGCSHYNTIKDEILSLLKIKYKI